MKVDPRKLKTLREARAMTQETLAAKCALSRKTIQRMETGCEVRAETVAFVAAALETNLVELTCQRAEADESDDPDRLGWFVDDEEDQLLVLRRASSGKLIFTQLSRSDLARVECDVDVDRSSIDLLTRVINSLDELVVDPWDEHKSRPARFSLVKRLQVIAALNDDLRELEAAGFSLYMGHYYRRAFMPQYDDCYSLIVKADQKPVGVMITRIMLSRSQRDRIKVPIDNDWTVKIARSEEEPDFTAKSETVSGNVVAFSREPVSPLDDEIPF